MNLKNEITERDLKIQGLTSEITQLKSISGEYSKVA